ncbi:histidine--tRNA ligase [Candidatus Falkowbacteria bacterium RIFOXYD2_FULL_35_9]|uniref:Histidine--tRNA ligase n=1 Tax=Candidatus Falkowbacteria bacterium RIFOXYC2_FULL_36_12 TaxID=1798002 RepID=A0A1F5T1K7_9BACT|nr:MAG: histidine--tRNA ligase [Candidatus Falkowbacteria bacterium RIFOXYB2_FULL_35_7]OGF32351.1 MAG: histidine--tRNA ligase [Candidatus Falkowbacteria bacterium RIFOXYC2_FULL_36_12]OGF46465.1 MAG: histidine--tRNA ligase [Candidatus Falkowbacteria bacterium RIFOXYD2_FULL_35_9]
MSESLLQRAKGVRDFGPEEKIERDRIVESLKQVFESFGFSPIETPIIERYELFASKFGQGDQSDSMKESFKLKDQGLRDLVLRNEFTIPFARYVGMNPNLRMPFKRYQIGQVFRDGPIKLGRYREFWQCDVDVVGNPDVSADTEILMIAQKVFAKLGFEVEIYLNNRKLLNAVLDKYEINKEIATDVIISIDKLDKIGVDGVVEELKNKNIEEAKAREFLQILNVTGTNEEKIGKLQTSLGKIDALQEIEQTINLMPNQENIVFLPSLARGLAYYTGNVFEIFLKDKNVMSSAVGGGGRYDKMIGGFLGKDGDIPAVGISFGLETILDVINKTGISEMKKTVTQVYVLAMGEENMKSAIETADQIRNLGINVDIDLQNRKLKKNLEYANALEIPYVVIIGSDEIEKKQITLRNMKDGSQKSIKPEEIKNYLN